MDRGDILSGAAFKSAALSAAIFLAVVLATGTAAYFYVQSKMLGELQSQIRAEQVLYRTIYDSRGSVALIEAVRLLEHPDASPSRAVGIFSATGSRVAGNIHDAPVRVGWSRQTLKIGYSAGTGRDLLIVHQKPYYVTAMTMAETTLVVGRNLDLMSVTENTLVRALAVAAFVVVASMLAVGYIVSRQSLRKLQGLEDTLDRVSQGDTTARLAVSRNNDQIDRISRRVNAHLDRLSKSMIGTKATTAAIAHDLKTPLARAFLGLEQAMTQIESNKDPSVAIETSLAELGRLNAIFETVLRIVRIESAGTGDRFARLDLVPLLEDLAETYEIVAEDKGQTLSLTVSGQKPIEVQADRQMLQQMVVNLLQNAITHSPPDTRIEMQLEKADGKVRLVIDDNGPGIPEADRARVLDPFYRGASDQAGDGSGLGLSLAKSVADRHGATLMLSDNMPGLRVVVEFPANGRD